MTTIPELETAIKEKRGNLAAVGRRFGVSRQAISKRVKNSAKLRKAYLEARETMLDNAETSLNEIALGGNVTALIFLLKTQAKDRGYIERQEVMATLNVKEMTDDELLAITSSKS